MGQLQLQYKLLANLTLDSVALNTLKRLIIAVIPCEVHHTFTCNRYPQEITLYAQGPCSPTQSNTLVVVNIQHCPPGFQLSMNDPVCICADRLQQFTNTCLVDNTTVLRAHNAEFWVGYDNESRGLILHPNCPFDHCTSEETYLAVDDINKPNLT